MGGDASHVRTSQRRKRRRPQRSHLRLRRDELRDLHGVDRVLRFGHRPVDAGPSPFIRPRQAECRLLQRSLGRPWRFVRRPGESERNAERLRVLRRDSPRVDPSSGYAEKKVCIMPRDPKDQNIWNFKHQLLKIKSSKSKKIQGKCWYQV